MQDPPVRGGLLDVLESPIPDRTHVHVLPAHARLQRLRCFLVDRSRREAQHHAVDRAGGGFTAGPRPGTALHRSRKSDGATSITP